MARQRLRMPIPAAVAVLVAMAFLAGAGVDRAVHTRPAPQGSALQRPSLDFALIHQAWDIIIREYVDRSAVGSGALTAGAINGMVDSLGDTGHSTYLTPTMVDEERSMMRGEYVGVGLEITQKNDGVVIAAPLDGSPAIRAGLRAGQQILKVNGQSVEGLGLSQVVSLIIGPAETTVVLSIYDPASGNTSEVPLKRARIRVDNVSWRPFPGYPFADLRVAAFSRGVAHEVRAALRQIEDMKLQGVVLDLRNDPGGDLQEAIGVASQFLSGGDVVLEKDAKGRIAHDAVQAGGVATALPLVVLINEGTASGAEIVAGAIQDAKRAELIGQTTFGTGTVLQNFPLSDGSSLLLAVREWLTPGGRTIWHKGIVPDMPVSLSTDATLLTPSIMNGISQKGLETGSDSQMKRALGVLTLSSTGSRR